ncbi:Group 4 capsule polysaccharide lipoprotein gfcB, YjbF [Roseovarius litoreus]|uniref:Group 4 capsule polysaccharide lipoprotein gfcB, YjbF n=1 Tax=Roseovarius litoreus TaxID=1155722 RepID=A0A1M7KWE4_9RHOB|nr:YjbF family lipoprotein [Roseovarius litoreus]SHM69582.1 Group 4 capsule polysaccharide lipoprotein gfcB, YjbF [Roseovarius litoreus]
MRKPALILCSAVMLLTACSSREDSAFSEMRGLFQKPPNSERFVALFEAQAPALEVLFVRTQSVSRLLLSHENRGVLTWLSIEGASLKTRNGFIVGSRGFFEGLQAARVDEVERLVRAEAAGTANRFHTYLDGNNDVTTRSYRCVITPGGMETLTLMGQTASARRISEECRNLTDDFTNIYWVGNGEILQAVQWIGPIAGSLLIRLVNIYDGQ